MMLKITIPSFELWDEANERFINRKAQTLQLEHSLVSVSKWESKWKIPFLSKDEKTIEQTLDYVRCMTLTQNVDPLTYSYIPDDAMESIINYINDKMTATWFSKDKDSKPNQEVITSELIYYWMITLNIPLECQKWNLSRLFTLIRVCEIKNKPPKKISKNEAFKRNAALNAARRSKYHSKG